MIKSLYPDFACVELSNILCRFVGVLRYHMKAQFRIVLLSWASLNELAHDRHTKQLPSATT